MSVTSFFPSNEPAQIIWLTNYAEKIVIYGPICGITDEEITSTLTDITYYIWMLQYFHPDIRRKAKAATALKAVMVGGSSSNAIDHTKDTLIPEAPPVPEPGIRTRLFSQVIRIKASSKYNEDIGHILIIISSPGKENHLIPEFTAIVELGATDVRVRIDFKKHGHDGIWIESRSNGSEWAFLAIDTVKPYLDERPLTAGLTHEVREYRMRWWDKSLPHGEWSAAQKVALGI